MTSPKLATEFATLADRAEVMPPAVTYTEQQGACALLGQWALDNRTEITAALRASAPTIAGEDEREAFNSGIDAAQALVEARGSYGDEGLAQRIGELRKL